jgi:hypothetical protein
MSAQARADFTGKWTRVDGPDRPVGTGQAAISVPREFIVVQDEKTLTVTVIDGHGLDGKSVHQLDGTESMTELSAVSYRTARSNWDGAKLVTTTRVVNLRDNVETKQIWALDSAGHLLIEMTRRFSGRPRPAPARTGLRQELILAIEPSSSNAKATYRRN